MCRLWSPWGFLSFEHPLPLLGIGTIDFAGTSVVHMVGGLSAFIGAYFIGPRKGRYLADGKPNPAWAAGHSAMLVCFGTFILWTGWYDFDMTPHSPGTLHTDTSMFVAPRMACCRYGFNSGSAIAISGREAIVSRTAVVSTAGAAGGALAAVAYDAIFGGRQYRYGRWCLFPRETAVIILAHHLKCCHHLLQI